MERRESNSRLQSHNLPCYHYTTNHIWHGPDESNALLRGLEPLTTPCRLKLVPHILSAKAVLSLTKQAKATWCPNKLIVLASSVRYLFNNYLQKAFMENICWYSRRESNPHLWVRSPVFYSLDYSSIKICPFLLVVLVKTESTT